MEIAKVLALVSLMIYLVAFGLYNRQIITGRSKPNAAMWSLWVFLVFVNTASYRVMTGDWVKSLIAYAGCVAITGTFILSLRLGKFTRLGVFDWCCLGLGITAIGVWWIMRDVMFANFIIQASVTISFIPTYRGVWKTPHNERPVPWFLFSLCYVITFIVVVMRWQGQIQDLVFPLNNVVLHLLVGLLSLRRTN